MLNYSKGTSLGEKKEYNSFIPHKQGPTSTAQALWKFFIGLYVDHLPFLDCTSSPLAEGPVFSWPQKSLSEYQLIYSKEPSRGQQEVLPIGPFQITVWPSARRPKALSFEMDRPVGFDPPPSHGTPKHMKVPSLRFFWTSPARFRPAVPPPHLKNIWWTSADHIISRLVMFI